MAKELFPPQFEIDCEWQGCLDRRAVWEAFPPVYVRDPVCAEPCDNCAFRPGSHEQQDPERWKALIESLKPGDEGWFTGRFYCHKGVPIDMSKGPGNFLFPTVPVMMDGEPVANPDGSVVMMPDQRKMRVCTGYLKMFWARAEKQRAGRGEEA